MGGSGASLRSNGTNLQLASESWFEYENANLMKEYQRTGSVPTEDMYGVPVSESQRRQLKAYADALQEAAQQNSGHKTLYRGMVVEDVSAFTTGKVFTTDSLTATATDRRLASTYSNADNYFGSGRAIPVMMEFSNPVGNKGFNSQAGETILPKGATYRISSAQMVDGVYLIKLYQSRSSGR